MLNTITDVPGIKVGHYTDTKAITGCTVILCPSGAVAGVDVRGSAPGTRETALLDPICRSQQVHAIVLSGGSAFGLETAGGVMRYLEEHGHGLDVGVAKIPIVPAAILFDLFTGDPKVRPGVEEGYKACLAATDTGVAEGSVGAGTGAAVGKAFGREQAIKSGVGTASHRCVDGTTVGAIVAVNAFGDVVDPSTGKIMTGPRDPNGKGIFSTTEILAGCSQFTHPFFSNTTIGVIATDAPLTKVEANKLAQIGHDGIAIAIRPCHTVVDGDVLFALSTSDDKNKAGQANMLQLGVIATQVISEAIVRAVTQANSLGNLPALKDIRG